MASDGQYFSLHGEKIVSRFVDNAMSISLD
jgi:hypothetical protein